MRIVEQTLAEQMKFSDREIAKRKQLFDLKGEDVAILRSCKTAVVERLDWAIDEFYARQIDDPEIALIIGDSETLSRLKGAMRNYIVELFGGIYDNDYVNSRLRVGKVHWRIGVTPKFFLSALRRLNVVLCAIMDEISDTPIELHARKEAVQKILFFDSQLVFDTYINALSGEVTAAKDETAAYARGLEEEVARRTHQMKELTLTDELTGVNNKRAFGKHAKRKMTSAQRANRELSLLYIDINDFKLLNDTLGHQVGDDLLVKVARHLQGASRASDIVCRLGGDEFCILMPDAPASSALDIAERFAELMYEEASSPCGASVGIATTGPTQFCTVEELVTQADQSMYRAKQRNKGSGKPGLVCIDNPLLSSKDADSDLEDVQVLQNEAG
ncbi:GGDEF domain-containing protein [Parvibaculaceae bacterium PLY_AMNH_Bact1]|nr:GGDEF domain-containing protein [Parvibaculaceae bacterium PLY_AMNH_Bact1]